MVRPCVARGFRRAGECGLASMYPACDWSAFGSGPSWISARVRAHYRTGLERAIRVTSVRMRREERSSISAHPLADLGGLEATGYLIASSLGGCRDFPRLEVPAMSKNAPGDASQLVGERDGEHVVV